MYARSAFRVFSLALLAVAAVSAMACTGAAASSAPVRRDLVTRKGTFTQTMTLTGELEAADSSSVAVPRLPSWQTTVRWLIADGSEVRAGDKVAELDDGEVSSSLEAMRTAAESAEHALEQKRADVLADLSEKAFELEKKRTELEKAKIAAALPQDLLSRREYQDLQLRLAAATSEHEKSRETHAAAQKAATAELRNLEIALERAQTRLNTGKEALEAIVLRAPRDGIAIVEELYWEERKIRTGDAVFVGMKVVTIPVMQSLRVQADLWDVDDGRIAPGQEAIATMDAWPDERFKARITSVSGVAKERGQQSLRRAFEVTAALDRIDTARMRPGFSVRLDVVTSRIPAAILVPREAIRLDGKRAFAALADGTERAIILGACNARECIAKSGIEASVKLARAVRKAS
ncbi:MAG: efflux RND transporter periplasmic adaptor subunit [Thermoanaerobaculia bacterium]